MTENLGKISKLKEAIDTLNTINAAARTIKEEVNVVIFPSLEEGIIRAAQKLDALKKKR
jgi:flavoprotein